MKTIGELAAEAELRKVEKTEFEAKKVDLEKKMPGISDKLKDFTFGLFDEFYRHVALDAEHIQTDRYDVVVAKWEESHMSDRGYGGHRWGKDGLLTVYARERSGGEIEKYKTNPLVISDRRGTIDTSLEEFKYTTIDHVNADVVSVAWTDATGVKKYEEKIDVSRLKELKKERDAALALRELDSMWWR